MQHLGQFKLLTQDRENFHNYEFNFLEFNFRNIDNIIKIYKSNFLAIVTSSITYASCQSSKGSGSVNMCVCVCVYIYIFFAFALWQSSLLYAVQASEEARAKAKVSKTKQFFVPRKKFDFDNHIWVFVFSSLKHGFTVFENNTWYYLFVCACPFFFP